MNIQLNSNFVPNILLENKVNSRVQDFIGNCANIYTGTICHEWTVLPCKKTSMTEALSSTNRLIEAKRNNLPINEELFEQAVKTGSLEAFEWLKSNGGTWRSMEFETGSEQSLGENVLILAIYRGNLDILEWLYNDGCTMTTDVFYTAICLGDIGILDWLWSKESTFDLDEDVFDLAEFNIDTQKWLLSKGCLFYARSIIDDAVRDGQIENVKFLRSIGCYWDKHTFELAVINGSKAMVQWMLKNECPCWKSSVMLALESGKMDGMIWEK